MTDTKLSDLCPQQIPIPASTQSAIHRSQLICTTDINWLLRVLVIFIL